MSNPAARAPAGPGKHGHFASARPCLLRLHEILPNFATNWPRGALSKTEDCYEKAIIGSGRGCSAVCSCDFVGRTESKCRRSGLRGSKVDLQWGGCRLGPPRAKQ